MAMEGLGGTITDGTTHANESEYGSWRIKDEGGVMYMDTITHDPDDTDAEFISPAIPGALVNGKKILVGIKISNAGADEASGYQIEGSVDGKNWTRIGSELNADITPNVTGTVLDTVDLSAYTLPWYRITANDDTNDLTTVEFSWFVGGLANGANIGLMLDAETSRIGGIGKDPS